MAVGTANSLTLVESTTKNATWTSDIVELLAETMAVTLDITAVSGTTPSMTVVIEDAPTVNGPWTTLLSFTAQTAVGTNVQRTTPNTPGAIHRYVRARSSVFSGTTPSFTFSVRATGR